MKTPAPHFICCSGSLSAVHTERQFEPVIVNSYGDAAEQYVGSTQGYAEYLAGYEAAENKLDWNRK